jgi:hypothetical protein
VNADETEVKDPWFGEMDDFERCFEHLDRLTRDLIEKIKTAAP